MYSLTELTVINGWGFSYSHRGFLWNEVAWADFFLHSDSSKKFYEQSASEPLKLQPLKLTTDLTVKLSRTVSFLLSHHSKPSQGTIIPTEMMNNRSLSLSLIPHDTHQKQFYNHYCQLNPPSSSLPPKYTRTTHSPHSLGVNMCIFQVPRMERRIIREVSGNGYFVRIG